MTERTPDPLVCSVILVARGDEQWLLHMVQTLRRAVAEGISTDVIVVVNGPPLAPVEVLREAGARLVQLPSPVAYPVAIESALKRARYEVVALFDPRDRYEASELPRLMSHAEAHDMVVGVRAKGRAGLGRRFCRFVLRQLAELLTGQTVPDPTSGFRVTRRSHLIRYAPLAFRGIGLTTMLTVGMLIDGLQVAFVPIQYEATARGGRRAMRGWLEVMHLMARATLLFNPLRVFAMPGYALLGSGTLLLAASALGDGSATGWGLALFLWGAIVLATAFLADALGGLGRAAGRR